MQEIPSVADVKDMSIRFDATSQEALPMKSQCGTEWG